MTRNTNRLIVALTAFGLVASPALGIASAYAGCPAGDRIDGSTAAQAAQKMQRAGYDHVRSLKKSCDNDWHAIADRDGKDGRIVLTTQGQVLVENDGLQGQAASQPGMASR
jgi:hypothetical protein